ncbi:MAG: DUF5103 domain-containing protein [Macellibacteroides fermentans]|uniref:type IX secretion system plug protein n=1 Tax=Macellibacteroides fermentans TaxID=879969 RepID=UPI003AD15EC5
MKRFELLVLILSFLFVTGNCQETYCTEVKHKQIKTLQVKVQGETFSTPVIELNSRKVIEINFDALSHGYGRYAYTITHCNADWTPSVLSSLEYMSGFQNLSIDDFANSLNTTTFYTNYRLFLPNNDIKFKVSGNYVVKVYNEDRPKDIVFTACFSIVEPKVNVAATVSSNTDIDVYKEHQQIGFEIVHPNYEITAPQSDLKVQIYQNNRCDNMVKNIQPLTIAKDRIIYQFNRDLIFAAGNEYRRIEFLSNKYNGMGVQRIQFHRPYYHIDLYQDRVRSDKPYLYDQDQNGQYVIRSSQVEDPDTEADYYIVHFSLASKPIVNGNIHISGNLFNNVLNENSCMEYNEDARQYEKSVLLKQGTYNYQYLFVPDGQQKGETAPVEGNFSQTSNEYRIMVYHRPFGSKFDKLIAVKRINFPE